ncbi:hypothetical protein OO256_11000, partial [Pseudomonas sp. DCB_CB]|uniref:hypothetical protein n=1 Tax=unclassified Pseudomonas TaxID=196821 RepID=UPI00224920A9
FLGHLLDRFDLELFGVTLTTHGTSYLGLIMRLGGVYETRGDSVRLKQVIEQRDKGKPTYNSEGVYTFEGEVGRFCTACWDSDERKMRLTDLASEFRFVGQWECPKCHAGYGAKDA